MPYQPPIQAKAPSLSMDRFQVQQKPKEEQHEFEHWIEKTSKLIKRPYIQTFRLVKDWPLEKIIRHYELATKHNGDMPEDVKWWWERKKLKNS